MLQKKTFPPLGKKMKELDESHLGTGWWLQHHKSMVYRIIKCERL